jgi:hypothetical protein
MTSFEKINLILQFLHLLEKVYKGFIDDKKCWNKDKTHF